ncbi:glycoside hydrolase family 16 protein [Rhizobium sp. CNPSo 4039]|uniref:glycoside hydrolase family 16 protein n=1 Tax=Rhizobium sp. CNPSo 4039 TaxID=3021409 RepID=UPI00254C37CB|nr:glycoside hydrolase family 16 protein [Rhizobium sp. CNPSo 4039]MDK4713677.1 glycoside hydrolase family 16 protein [Rhizobium sp. CNPSo 4039]
MTRSIILVFGAVLSALPAGKSFADTVQWPSVRSTSIKGPVAARNQDQPYAKRRPVTEDDRRQIEVYRSAGKTPAYFSDFSDGVRLQSEWDIHTDDMPNLKSCRQRHNVSSSQNGLTLLTLVSNGCAAKWSTGQIVSKAKYRYGYFEASMKIADIPGMDNAFWLTTDDHYEIDAVEAFFPNLLTATLHEWWSPATKKHTAVLTSARTEADLSKDFHDYGVLWSPTDIIFAIDGRPFAALTITGAAKAPAKIRLSNALSDNGGEPPQHPEGHNTYIRAVRVLPLPEQSPN